MSTSDVEISNSSCSNNSATKGSIIYSVAKGNNNLTLCGFSNNTADVGGLIYSVNGRNLSKINKLNDNNLGSDGCSSTVIQIDDNNCVSTFRKDSTKLVYVNIEYQKDGILQYETDKTFFWHAIFK